MLSSHSRRRPTPPISGVFRVCVAAAALTAGGCDLTAARIEGNAMAPALVDGDEAVLAPANTLERGDVIAFRYPRDPSRSFVMRIVGLPGEILEIVDGRVAIDGQPLDEPYVQEANRSFETRQPVVIPDGTYYVMGDNRSDSSDSRTWGLVAADLVWGRLLVR